jgi:hypothetical protein
MPRSFALAALAAAAVTVSACGHDTVLTATAPPSPSPSAVTPEPDVRTVPFPLPPPVRIFPAIIDFGAQPVVIDRGQSSTLTWEAAADVDHCAVFGPEMHSLDLPRQGTLVVTPKTTTWYSLWTYDADGQVRQVEWLQVRVRR